MSPPSDSGRVTIHGSPEELDISIHSNRDTNLVVFLLGAFAFNLLLFISALRSKDLSGILWFAFCCFIARAILWTLWGREEISLRGRTMTLQFKMPGVGRASRFDLSNVDAFRIFKPPVRQYLGLFMMYPDHRGRIIFDYNGKAHAFGVDLSQIEAEQVIRRIEQHDSATARNVTAQASV